MIDALCLVPFQPASVGWLDADVRRAFHASKAAALKARARFDDFFGDVTFVRKDEELAHRSLTAVVLATSLERAGLSWRVLDPGAPTLGEWRAKLDSMRHSSPRVVAISSTFIMSPEVIGTLCDLARRAFPTAKIVVGGYFYASSTKQFLALDADVLCVGEGEDRFARIVAAVRDGASLDDIPGLYLRSARGLRYTGDAPTLDLDTMHEPDWSLATRIEPPIDATRQPGIYGVETQRGCSFKCEFCTYRTLAAPAEASLDRAVERILSAASRKHGIVFLLDATATFPRERWRALLDRLIEAGGCPVPLTCYARVSDLDDDVCARMARAGVRRVLIGQESGDQRMLDAMRKGTRVAHVAPAMAAAARHGILADMLFFYGFPGESAESMRRTEQLLCTINDGLDGIAVQRTTLELFGALDFAAVRKNDAIRERDHRLSWERLEVSPERALEGILRTQVALSKLPRAPVTGFGVMRLPFEEWHALGVDRAMFPWAKAVDRGLGLFVDAELSGREPDYVALEGLRTQIAARLTRVPRVNRAISRVRERMLDFVFDEWSREHHRGVGPLTRAALAVEVMRATGRLEPAYRAFTEGRFPAIGMTTTDRDLSEKLVALGTRNGRKKRSSVARAAIRSG